MRELVHLEEAHRALELAVNIDEVRAIRDKAEAARAYARQIGLSLEMQDQCAEIKLRAERRVGEFLGSTARQRLGEYQRSHDATVASSLGDLRISKGQSLRCQTIARLPHGEFEGFIELAKERGAGAHNGRCAQARQKAGSPGPGVARRRGGRGGRGR